MEGGGIENLVIFDATMIVVCHLSRLNHREVNFCRYSLVDQHCDGRLRLQKSCVDTEEHLGLEPVQPEEIGSGCLRSESDSGVAHCLVAYTAGHRVQDFARMMNALHQLVSI